ncbi:MULTISPECIES: hypothetical protein [Rhodomicrobium]|uniref:Cap15 family cyclic dinucleotide receptor domain-containing protein n=1 Tax=Rhodomicrobium TaxID=1068 RepID=UPI000B4C0E9F|nr:MULTISPECIES: hypothetical protein [Rhodomicrobium]
MWTLLPLRWQILIVLGIGAALAWSVDGALALLAGRSLTVVQLISFTATLVGLMLTWFAELSWRWLWRHFPTLQRKAFPDLNGQWEGTLRSTWIDPKTDQPIAPIPIAVAIHQGLFATSVRLRTNESRSYSTKVFLEPHHDARRFRLCYTYCNDPDAAHQHRSAPHDGHAFLELDFDDDKDRLTGRYFTSRKTTGDLELRRASVK